MTTKFPLFWQQGWPVTEKKTVLRHKRTWSSAEAELESICRRMKIKDAVLSSNFHDGKYHGSTAVSFCFTHQGIKMAVYCDRYFSATHNLCAIVETMRSALLKYKYNLTFYKFQNSQ